MAASVLLHGPQGSGKTLIAQRLAKHLGLTKVIEADDHENWRRLDWPATGAVVVTVDPQLVRGFSGRRIHINEALGRLGLKSATDVLKGQTK